MIKTIAARALFVAGLCCTFADEASAQASVNGPYYATPSWDQTLPASSRFLVLANFNAEAVLDRETGLVWQRTLDSLAALPGTYADRCLQAKIGGRLGWRLPTLPEFASLFDAMPMAVPPLPPGHPFLGFPTTGRTSLVTSTNFTGGGFPAAIFYENFHGTPDIGIGAFGGEGRALCVRGGTPAGR